MTGSLAYYICISVSDPNPCLACLFGYNSLAPSLCRYMIHNSISVVVVFVVCLRCLASSFSSSPSKVNYA